MTDNPLVSIVVLNFNGAEILEQCLRSLGTIRYKPLEIIVVDNNSTDNSTEIAESFSGIKVIRNRENYGYAEGNNIGISHAAGKYVVTLNNDITVDPGFLDTPVRHLETDPAIGLVCCRQMSYFNKEIIDGLYHSIKRDLSFLPFGQHRTLNEDPRFLQTGAVISVNGGSAILRKSMFSELGGFDPRFFAYWDEVDLSMRAFLHGWRCLYVPDAVVYHMGSISFKKTGAFQYFFRERNRIWFLYKYFPMTLLMKHLIFMLITELRVIRIFFFKLRKPGLYLRARCEAAANLPSYRESRKKNLVLFNKRWPEFKQLKKKCIISDITL